MSTLNDIINRKEIELSLLKLAYFKCDNCGFVKLSDCYVAISHYICCNICGDEIKE